MKPFRVMLRECFDADDFASFISDNLSDIHEIEASLPKPQERVCNFCGKIKDITDFYRHPRGRFTKCKECIKKSQRKTTKALLVDNFYGF